MGRSLAAAAVVGLFLVGLVATLAHDVPGCTVLRQFPFDKTDEGWWAHNARIHWLEGRWFDGTSFEPLRSTPFYGLLLRVVWVVLGCGWLQGRILSLICGLAILLTGLILSRAAPESAPPWVLLLLASHPLVFFLSRIGTNEVLPLALAMGSLCFLRAGSSGKRAGPGVLAGLLFGLAMGSKATVLLLLPAWLFWIWRSEPHASRRDALGAFVPFVGGLLLAQGALRLWMSTMPPSAVGGGHYVLQKLPFSLDELFRYLGRYLLILLHGSNTLYSPVVLQLTFMAFLMVMLRPRRSWKAFSALDGTALIWIASCWGVFAVTLSWARYHLLLVPPLLWLAFSQGLPASIRLRRLAARSGRLRLCLLALSFVLLASLWLAGKLAWLSHHRNFLSPEAGFLTHRSTQFTAAFVLLGLWLALFHSPRRMLSDRRLSALAVGLTVLFQLGTVLGWIAVDGGELREARASFRRLVGTDAPLVAGTVADTLALGTRCPVITLHYALSDSHWDRDIQLRGTPRWLILDMPAPGGGLRWPSYSPWWLQRYRSRFHVGPPVDLAPGLGPDRLKYFAFPLAPREGQTLQGKP